MPTSACAWFEANLDNDGAGIEECRRLMQPLREAWASIAPDATRKPPEP